MFDLESLRASHPVDVYLRETTGQTGKSQGHWLMFFCPFHGHRHRTPSLGVNPDRDYWECFSCGQKGSVIDLVMTMKSLDFVEACKDLGAETTTPEVYQAWKDEENKRRDEEATRLQAKRDIFGQSGYCQKLHAQMGAEQRSWWQGRGIPDDWQDFWCLGWTPDLWGHGEAYSLPFFPPGSQLPVTVQYRYAVENGLGKYKFEPDLGSAAYIARPDWPLDKVIVVEGAIKAQVTHLLGTEGKMQVVGFPSEGSDGGIIPRLQESEIVYVILDPDTWENKQGRPGWEPPAIKFCRKIGKHARYVQFPVKLDDALLAGWLDSSGLKSVLRFSRTL